MYTNKTIEIFKQDKDWQGNLNLVSEGSFDVYLEERSNKNIENESIRELKGFFILFNNIDLEGKQIKYDEKTFVIASWDRFWFPGGDFHHIEADFK